MDEATFDSFLQEQRADLADIDLIVFAWATREQESDDPDVLTRLDYRHPLEREKTLRSQFDTACRRLADAYMICNDSQREKIRELVRTMSGVRASMGIPFTEIRLKMDAAVFRLALIFESMKDLGADTRDATMALDDLCRAARLAGIDPDPILREVAAVSCNVDHHHMGSMKCLLLERVTGGGARIRCPKCGNDYSSTMPRCPHCESHDEAWNLSDPRQRPETLGHPELFVAEDESPIYVPAHKLVGFAILGYAATYLVSVTAVQVLILCGGGELSADAVFRHSFLQIGSILLLCVFRVDRILRKYSTKQGHFRLRATRPQVILIVVVLLLTHVAFTMVWAM